MLNIKKILKITTFVLLNIFVLMVFVSVSAFATSTIYRYEPTALDTTFGNITYLSADSVIPNSDVVFLIKKPSGERVELDTYAKGNGVASVEVNADILDVIGTYTVFVRSKDKRFGGVLSADFIVSSAGVSADLSQITPANQSVVGDATIKVKLIDEFSNPVSDHYVKLVSSVESDVIMTDSNLSDTDGFVTFTVSSVSDGVVVYTAYDKTADIVLTGRAQVLYLESGTVNTGVFDYKFSSDNAIGNSDASMTRLLIDNVPEKIFNGDLISFDLSVVVGEDDDIVDDYVGTVGFALSGDTDNANYAQLPENYTFVADDLGKHSFTQVTSFLKPGVYDVVVKDIDNDLIYGSYTFTVLARSGDAEMQSQIILQQPSTDSVETVSNNTQIVSGIAPAGANVAIYDNGVLIGEVVAGLDGLFSFTTPMLTDGEHDIYVAILSDLGVKGDESLHAKLIIDMSSPEIIDFVMTPESGIKTGDTFSISMTVSDGTDSVSVIMNDEIYELINKGNGKFFFSMSAPMIAGDYSFDVILRDDLGNEITIDSYNPFTVTNNVHNAPVVSENGAGDKVIRYMPDVSGLVVTPGDSRVNLTWNPVEGASHYRVYYGDSSFDTSNAIDTFTNDTKWYVPNLENGHAYYFTVIAVSDDGAISENKSEILYGMPVYAVAHDFEDAPDPEIVKNYHDSAELSENGPALNVFLSVMFLLSLAVTPVFEFIKKSI